VTVHSYKYNNHSYLIYFCNLTYVLFCTVHIVNLCLSWWWQKNFVEISSNKYFVISLIMFVAVLRFIFSIFQNSTALPFNYLLLSSILFVFSRDFSISSHFFHTKVFIRHFITQWYGRSNKHFGSFIKNIQEQKGLRHRHMI